MRLDQLCASDEAEGLQNCALEWNGWSEVCACQEDFCNTFAFLRGNIERHQTDSKQGPGALDRGNSGFGPTVVDVDRSLPDDPLRRLGVDSSKRTDDAGCGSAGSAPAALSDQVRLSSTCSLSIESTIVRSCPTIVELAAQETMSQNHHRAIFLHGLNMRSTKPLRRRTMPVESG